MRAAEGGGTLLIDGEPMDSPDVKVDVRSGLWRSGASLFETMLVRRDGQFGLFSLGRHVRRLVAGARSLGWANCPEARLLEEWARRAAALFRADCSELGRLRLTVAWTRRHGPPQTAVHVAPYERPTRPATAVVTPVPVAPLGEQATPKAGSRLHYDLAEAIAVQRGADEGLLVDGEGRPVEGARSNLFAVVGGELFTAPTSTGALAGVTRAWIVAAADEIGASVHERALTAEALAGADELFLTNALWGVRPIGMIDGRSKREGPVTRALRDLYEAAAQRESE